MELTMYQIDAFTSRPLEGNPAAVVVSNEPLTDTLMQQIAAENNLSETAFICGGNGRYQIRWFTPKVEIDLCGHATLASAHVVLNDLEPDRSEVSFESLAHGSLRVKRVGSLFSMDFPVRSFTPLTDKQAVSEALGVCPDEFYQGQDLMAVFPTEEMVQNLVPNLTKLSLLAPHGFIVTAPGHDCDFVSRAFFPSMGIDEDPVTGATHTMLAPYWAGRLGRTKFHARQLSNRGGDLAVELVGDRVHIAGATSLYLRGAIFLPDLHRSFSHVAV